MTGVLVSAHRGGAGDDHRIENTLIAYERAIALGCDYVEIDIRRSADGRFVVIHDLDVESEPSVIEGERLEDVLACLKGRAKAHVDLKFAGGELAAVVDIVEELGADNIVITTAEDESIPRLFDWSRQYAPELLIGLSTSPRAGGATLRDRIHAWFPRRRLRRSGANVVVAQHTLARFWLRSYAHRKGLPLLVWTVDEPTALARWMNDSRTWMVTTNYPKRAFAARRQD